LRHNLGSAAAQFFLGRKSLSVVEGHLGGALSLNRAEALTDNASMGRAIAAGNAEWHYLALSQLSYINQ